MKRFYVFLLFLLLPALVWITMIKSYSVDTSDVFNQNISDFEHDVLYPMEISLKEPVVDIRDLSIQMSDLQLNMVNYVAVFEHYQLVIKESIDSSRTQRLLSADIYEQKITRILGEPIDFYLDDKTEIKIFELNELGYRGYIAKVKLFDPYVFKLALAKDRTDTLETITEVADRTNAIFAINGGGFGASKRDGELFSEMIGAAVVDGKLVKPFVFTEEESLFFVGINKYGKLVGNTPKNSEDVMNLSPYQGVSFIPILIKNGEKMTLPGPWKTSKHPRTIIGQYANGDLIMIVVDGRQGEWSSGITLERLQNKLIELGVKDAYNLDGGGSTAMYFKGRVLNKPSSGYERPVANHFIITP